MHADIEKVLAEIKDDVIRVFTTKCLEKIHEEFIRQAGSTGQHHAWPGGLLTHSVSVAMLGAAITDHYIDMGVKLNRDIVVSGGLLQDIGKVLCYRELPPYMHNMVEQAPPNKDKFWTAKFEKTYEDRHFHHIPIGFHMAMTVAEEMKLEDDQKIKHILHLIISHHGKKEWSSPQTPKTLEALICHTADQMDATMFAAPDFQKIKMEGASY